MRRKKNDKIKQDVLLIYKPLALAAICKGKEISDVLQRRMFTYQVESRASLEPRNLSLVERVSEGDLLQEPQ